MIGSREKKVAMLNDVLLIRRFEERVKELYEKKAIAGAIHLCIGQEAVPVGICAALRDDDFVFSNHRGHGHAIAKSHRIDRIMAELFGKDTGLSRGHGGSMHLFDVSKGLMGGNGIFGACVPLALGAAFSARYRGTDQVAVAFFSDGAVNQGVVAESLNLAALWKLPVLFVCENNHYAATTTIDQGTAVWNIRGRAESYGVPGIVVDGNDVEAVHAAATDAVAVLRRAEGPRFLECETYRMEPHCGIIPDDRRPGEREEWRVKDPVAIMKDRLIAAGMVAESEYPDMEARVSATIDAAVRFAGEAAFPDPEAAHNRSWIVEGGVPA